MSYKPKREQTSRRTVDRDRRNILSLESIAEDLRRIADKYIGTTGEPLPNGFHFTHADCGGTLSPDPTNPDLFKCGKCGFYTAYPGEGRAFSPYFEFSAKYFGTTGDPAADSLPFRERFELYTNPVGPNPYEAHAFQEVQGNRFCGHCGGGRLHAIHETKIQHNEQLNTPGNIGRFGAECWEFRDLEYSEPVGTWDPHEFVQGDGLTFCKLCVGGRLHAIHAAPTSVASFPAVTSDWNKAFPKGTAVTVEMPDGSKLSTVIASESFVIREVAAVFVRDLSYWVRLSQVMPAHRTSEGHQI